MTAPVKLLNSSFNEFTNLILIKGGTITNASLKVNKIGVTGTLTVNRGKIESILEDYGYLASTSDATNGILLDSSSTLWVPRIVVSGYTNGINASSNSTGILYYGYVVGCTTGVYAESMSYVRVMSERLFGNATDCNPVFDTQGNNYAFIESYSE